MNPEHFDDPVAAYNRLASHYGDFTRRREAYLRGVEREIISRLPVGSRSLLDVGAGDGSRALWIASSQPSIQRLVLAEPSREMARKVAAPAKVWTVRAEDLATVSDSTEPFDVITCLWNVLGHVQTAEKRLRALNAIACLLASQGKFFLDTNHRYNLRSYGLFPTGARWLRDLLSPGEHNGDALANWNMGASNISTYGHVFTDREIMQLVADAGLEMEERIVIDYESGRPRRFSFQGNLLYVFRRSSRIDSSSAPQTS